jgi:hypothetical protein
MGSHLIAIVPGVGVVRQLEEGRSDQEMTVRTADDLGEALRESVFGDRVTALLIWSTQGHRETMLMSGEAKRFALI